MKTTRYQFEVAVQGATTKTKQWLKDEFKAILESNKDYTRKADYIGFSISSIDDKVNTIDEEIKELQTIKKNLKLAKATALEVGAEVFNEFGVTKLEGAGISSITCTKATNSTQTKLVILEPQPLIDAGFYTKVLDEKRLLERFNDGEYLPLIQKYTRVETTNISKPSKLKVNKRRSVNNTTELQEVA